MGKGKPKETEEEKLNNRIAKLQKKGYAVDEAGKVTGTSKLLPQLRNNLVQTITNHNQTVRMHMTNSNYDDARAFKYGTNFNTNKKNLDYQTTSFKYVDSNQFLQRDGDDQLRTETLIRANKATEELKVLLKMKAAEFFDD